MSAEVTTEPPGIFPREDLRHMVRLSAGLRCAMLRPLLLLRLDVLVGVVMPLKLILPVDLVWKMLLLSLLLLLHPLVLQLRVLLPDLEPVDVLFLWGDKSSSRGDNSPLSEVRSDGVLLARADCCG